MLSPKDAIKKLKAEVKKAKENKRNSPMDRSYFEGQIMAYNVSVLIMEQVKEYDEEEYTNKCIGPH